MTSVIVTLQKTCGSGVTFIFGLFMFDRSELDAFDSFIVCDFEDSNALELLAFSKADSSLVILSRAKLSDNLVVKPRTKLAPESSFPVTADKAFDMFSNDQFLSE